MDQHRWGVLLLVATLISGCLGGIPGGAMEPPQQGTVWTDPGEEHVSGGLRVTVDAPVPLPDGFAAEPSVTVAESGVIAVAAPAGSANPTTVPLGGYVWVSRDGGESYDLVLDPRNPDAPGACSCDTDILAIGDDLYAATMYWSINPAFNVNLVASTDGGRSWSPRTLAGAVEGPIDRPWIAEGPGESLLLVYAKSNNLDSIVTGEQGPVFFQQSTDGGRTWSLPVTVADPAPEENYQALKLASTSDGVILIPVQHERIVRGEGLVQQPHIARSDDGGTSFTLEAIAEPYVEYAAFSYSLDVGQEGRARAVWSAPDASGVNRLHWRGSPDSGLSWGPVQIPEVPGTAIQPWVSVRGDGMTAIAFYGTDVEAPVYALPEDAEWFSRVAVLDADGELAGLVNLSTEPIYVGVPCNSSLSCPNGTARSPLREFLSADWGPDRALFVGFTQAWSEEWTAEEGRIHVTRLVVETEGRETEKTGGDAFK